MSLKMGLMVATVATDRNALIRRGQRLEYFSLIWNGLEGLAALIAGAIAGSISLRGFGLDSAIEVVSGVALLWRINVDNDVHRRPHHDRVALRIVGICFLGLAAYITFQSGYDLVQRNAPESSLPGIVIACASLIAMPLLARAKRNVGRGIGSTAMGADARQADFCAYLAAILLSGLLLNWTLRWWWADPVAALVMVPIIAKEGVNAMRGKACDDSAPRALKP